MVDKIFDKSHLDNTEEDKKEQKKSDLFEDMVTDEEKIIKKLSVWIVNMSISG